MARGTQLPKWWQVVEALETLQDMRRAHRADGVVTPEEEAQEERFLVQVVMTTAVDSADCQSLAQAIARGGPESDHARRMLRSRERRVSLGGLVAHLVGGMTR